MNSSFPLLAVFDLAGTTVLDEKYVHQVLQKTMASHGVAITIEAANAVMGIPKPVAIRQLLQDNGLDPKPLWIDQMHSEFVERMRHFYRTELNVREIAGASAVFRALREAGVKVFVDTGFDRAITDPLLERMNWNGLVDGSVTSDEVTQGRPFADLIFRAMELAGVSKATRVMKVGDTPSDLQEGAAAGCGWIIGITGNFTREALGREPHTHIIDALDEIPGLLGLAY
jgi:phosphonatase-like hydrolase